MGSKWSLPWPTTTIDRIEQLGNIEFSFEKLSKKYGTFRSYSNGTDRLGRKKFRSRVGVQTDYGDIEVTLTDYFVYYTKKYIKTSQYHLKKFK